MSWKETYTKVFLKQSGKAVTEASIKEFMPIWWQNTRSKNTGGLRLTEEGFRFVVEDLDIQTYDVPFPADFNFTTNSLIWLDQFIDCPYFISRVGISVLNEKKALELHLFSGDVKKYGLTKALKRADEELTP